jgi:hypothetical protein
MTTKRINARALSELMIAESSISAAATVLGTRYRDAAGPHGVYADRQDARYYAAAYSWTCRIATKACLADQNCLDGGDCTMRAFENGDGEYCVTCGRC